jgi:hypothetical protein
MRVGHRLELAVPWAVCIEPSVGVQMGVRSSCGTQCKLMSVNDLPSSIRLPPPPPFVQGCPQASMAFHGRPALPHKKPDNSRLVACPVTRAAASVDLLRVRAGGTSGGTRQIGGIDALGVSTTGLPCHHYRGTRLNVPSYLLELADEPNSYGQVATLAGNSPGSRHSFLRPPLSGGSPGRSSLRWLHLRQRGNVPEEDAGLWAEAQHQRWGTSLTLLSFQ